MLGKIMTRYPGLANKASEKVPPIHVEGRPWSPLKKKLRDSTVALVTTAGVHLRAQQPFDMKNPEGDATYREIPLDTPPEEYMITHDYYDHSDADKDINVVFPIDRLREFASEGRIGALADMNYGFMGHMAGAQLDKLTGETAPALALKLKDAGVDVVIFTPG
jgi:D-proline reductase (dithiol) PrdB